MFIVAKTIKGKEFIYSNNFSILCNSKKQAEMLANHLNKNNDSASEKFKLKENEIWYVYEIDKYDSVPMFKLKNTRNRIAITYNI